MSSSDVYRVEMHGEEIDDRVGAFFQDLRTTFGTAAVPTPDARLSTLFATGLVNEKGDRRVTAASNANGSATPQTAGLPNWTRRRIAMMKEMLSSLGTKATAGVVGAALTLGGLGVAGAVTGTMGLIAETSDTTVACSTDGTTDGGTATDGTTDGGTPTDGTTDGDVAATEEIVDDTTGDTTEECTTDDTSGDTTDDGTAVPTVPVEDGSGEEGDDLEHDGEDEAADGTTDDRATTDAHGNSAAAQNHEFDDACGNHGAYVSEMAKARKAEGFDAATYVPECASAPEADAPAVVAPETQAAEADSDKARPRGKSGDRRPAARPAPAKGGGSKGKGGAAGGKGRSGK